MTANLRATMVNLAYIVMFQLGWLVCAAFGDTPALIYSALYLAFHFFILNIYGTIMIRKELWWLMIFVVSGFFVETLFFSTGLLSFEEPSNTSHYFTFPPIWLLCMWLLFSVTMRTTMSFLFYKPWLAFPLIIIFVPISYFFGASLNKDVILADPIFLSLPAIAMVWVVFFGLLLILKKSRVGDIFNDR